MAITISSNFGLQSKLPNFERDQFDTLEKMKNLEEFNIDEGHISYCLETNLHYIFRSSNEIDPTTGRWRLFSGSGSIDPSILDKKADLVNGKIPTEQLPSYVDDVIEVDTYTNLPGEGETGKIYITTDDNKTYRWGGTTYVEVSSGGGGTLKPFATNAPINNPIGGFQMGDEVIVGENMSLEDAINKILHKHVAPSVTLTANPATTLYEKETTVTIITFSSTVTKQSENIVSGKLTAGSTELGGLTDPISNGGTMTGTLNNIEDDVTVVATVDDGISPVTRSISIKFAYRSYYGVVEDSWDITLGDVTLLDNSRLSLSRGLTYSGINATNQKVVYAYPAGRGDLTSILDKNGFEMLPSFTKGTWSRPSTVTGQPAILYNVYMLTAASTVTDFQMIFK